MKQKEKSRALVIWFKDLRIGDTPLVGGKNAALGEMYANLTSLGVNVPNGFAVTAAAYRFFIEEAGLGKSIKAALRGLDTRDIRDLQRRGKKVRNLIMAAKLPEVLEREILVAYQALGPNRPSVAVRSSATAEDLPGASFAGQQETYLNVRGERDLLTAVKRCIASLFTDRAISYRVDKGFSHFDVALSVGIQKMVRSDKGTSGVVFTIDTETGFDKVVVVTGVYGLGEMIVQGEVIPDEFIVFKPTLARGFPAIIAQNLGRKDRKLVYAREGTRAIRVPPEDRNRFCLSEKEVLTLARWGVLIETHFSKLHGRNQPMDIEWAKDGISGELFVVQARPETVHAIAGAGEYREYVLGRKGKEVVRGMAVGMKIASGKATVLRNAKEINKFRDGEILVTEITDPDWEPIMKKAAAIVTDKGGRTSHAAIVSRELGIPCVVGAECATRRLRSGKRYTVDCSSGSVGKVYEGSVPYRVIEHALNRMPTTRTKVMVNIGSPDEAFKHHILPAQGVGLGRLEFIIASHIGIHPNALIEFPKLKKLKGYARLVREIEKRTAGYEIKTCYYVNELAEGIAKIGAAFWPHEVIIRFSDFKTNEYRKLLGGERYESEEENPMIGWRGASRYYDPKFEKAFGLECEALKKVREKMGLTNVVPMVPFCRTPEEGRKVLAVMKRYGLDRVKDKTLKVYVMCEIPSNVLLAERFLDLFDGMSIGSNDLTQLTLGLDRDSGIVTHIANENNEAVKTLIAETIKICNRRKKYIGICGQAPSDYPEFTAFLVRAGIHSVSLNPDTVVKAILAIAKIEKKRKL